jgi:hypothetical protein
VEEREPVARGIFPRYLKLAILVVGKEREKMIPEAYVNTLRTSFLNSDDAYDQKRHFKLGL